MKAPCPTCSHAGYHCEVGHRLKTSWDAATGAYGQCVQLPESPSRAGRVADARIAMVSARTRYVTHINEGWTPPEDN